MGEVIGLADMRVHESKREVERQVVYHECRPLEITLQFNADAFQRSLEEAIVGARDTLGDDQPEKSSGGVIVSVSIADCDETVH